ncbi:hypothetical protein SH449x_001403 [Pirellulaceae bacterium SH449]
MSSKATRWIAAIPNSSVEPMMRSIDRLPDSTRHNYRCRMKNAIALISTSEHQRLPGKILVAVSKDLQRIWRITRLVGDEPDKVKEIIAQRSQCNWYDEKWH